MITVIKIRVRINVEPDEVGYYAYCPELKGVHVGGDSEDGAVQNAKDAAVAYLHSMLVNGEPLPKNGHISPPDNRILPELRACRA